MDPFPRISNKEFLILEMLQAEGELYGLDMVKKSNGRLKRGTVYSTLMRMGEKGLVESRQEERKGEPGIPRRLYKMTGHGARALSAMQMARSMMSGKLDAGFSGGVV